MSLLRPILLSLVCGLCGLLPLTAAAEDKPVAADPARIINPRKAGDSAEPVTTRASGYGTGIVAIVLLASAGGWWFWRQRTSLGGAAGAARHKLVIAETKSLGNRQYLLVASYEDKKFLLAVCPGRIDLLTPLDNPAKSP